VRSWLSSPLETNRFLAMCCDKIDPPDKNADAAESLFEASIFPDADAETHEVSDPPKKGSLKTQEEKIAGLIPIREKIALMTVAQDDKIARSREILVEHFAQKHKVIVFVDRLATAFYLKTKLTTVLPGTRIGCTVGEQKADGRFPLVSAKERKDMVCRFSPVSNRVENFNPKDEFDLLICTDADGIGLNMQDACVVVNYDLPYTADELFQRAGRVLRMTDDPQRTIFLYTLVPKCRDAKTSVAQMIDGVLEKLTKRHNASTALLGGKVIAGEDEIISLASEEDLAQFAKMVHSPLEATMDLPNPVVGHIAFFERNKHRVGNIAEVTLSAKEYAMEEPRVVLVVWFEQKYHLICYNVVTEQCEKKGVTEILDMICSQSETEDKVFINATKVVEKESISAMQAWLTDRGTTDEANGCLRVCSIYLDPSSNVKATLKRMLRTR